MVEKVAALQRYSPCNGGTSNGLATGETAMKRKESSMNTVVIAGASGFIGRKLCEQLAGTFDVVALTRNAESAARANPELDVRWVECDLFSLTSTEQALDGADFAVYLVHSMMPSTGLTQASFDDLDLLLADNFGRAAAARGVQQIVYLGGLVPPGGSVSDHLRSRVEVEEALADRGVPTTVLRAGLVVGKGGSSFRILPMLVSRLPVMLLPSWTSTKTTPIALSDVVELLAACVGDEATFGMTTDVGGPETLTYREMIWKTAEALGQRKRLVSVPLLTPRLSALWVSLVTGTSMALVRPLVRSLECEMIARDRTLQARLEMPGLSFEQALVQALDVPATGARQGAPRARRRKAPTHRLARSVQRLPRPQAATIAWIADEYVRWLPRYLRPFVSARIDDETHLSFRLSFYKPSLLELTHAPEGSRDDRAVYTVTGGMLADLRGNERGRLEFRAVLGDGAVIAAVHDFAPRLPWRIYLSTQALVHLWVMRGFGRHLGRQPPPEAPLR